MELISKMAHSQSNWTDEEDAHAILIAGNADTEAQLDKANCAPRRMLLIKWATSKDESLLPRGTNSVKVWQRQSYITTTFSGT